MSPTQESPDCVLMCDTGSEGTVERKENSVAYRILVRNGWRAGQRLGVNGGGLKHPLSRNMYGDEDRCQELANNVGILLENQFFNIVECDEGGSMCEFCTRRGREVYTIFHELDESVDMNDDYSLPRLPEISVWLYGRSMNALIDTGSQISGITRELYETIRKEGREIPEIAIPAIQVQGAFGSRSESTNRLVLIEIKLGSTLVEAPVLIMRRLPRSLILGYDWLERVKGVVDCGKERTLTIEHLGVRSSVRLNSDCEIDRLGGALNASIINSVLKQSTRQTGCSLSSGKSANKNS